MLPYAALCLFLLWVAVCFGGTYGIHFLFNPESFTNIPSLSAWLKKLHVWDEQREWQLANCTVLAMGVHGVGNDPRLDWVFDDSIGDMPYSVTQASGGSGQDSDMLVFESSFSSCPGNFLCASEGEKCRCNGKVTYVATTDSTGDMTGAEHVMSNGEPVVCSHEQRRNGAFKSDPKRYVTKQCFCTPGKIMKLTDAHKSQALPDGKTCAHEANMDYDGRSAKEAAGLRATVSPHATHHSDMNRTLSGRRLNGRIHVRFIPWAFVEVHEQNSRFGSAKSDTKFRCAYEWGAPKAQAALYDTGYYRGTSFVDGLDQSGAGDVLRKWQTMAPNRSCWVRKKGVAGQDSCAVALQDSGSLEHKINDSISLSRTHIFYGQIFAICLCMPICCFLALLVLDLSDWVRANAHVFAREKQITFGNIEDGSATCQYDIMREAQ